MLLLLFALFVFAICAVVSYREGLRADAEQERREEWNAARERELAERRDREEAERQAEWDRRVEVKFGAVFVDGKLDVRRSVFF